MPSLPFIAMPLKGLLPGPGNGALSWNVLAASLFLGATRAPRSLPIEAKVLIFSAVLGRQTSNRRPAPKEGGGSLQDSTDRESLV